MSTLRADTILPYTSGSQITIYGFTGAATSPTPCANDYVGMYSYRHWAYGQSVFGSGQDVDKFTALTQENDPGDYLQFELVAGQVNGINISTCPSYSINVTSADVNFRDDGFGTYASNYIDFINGVFASHSLYTRLTGSAQFYSNDSFVTNYCKVDNFYFIFKETGQLTPNNASFPMYYIISSIGGAIIKDGIGDQLSAINSIETGGGGYWIWI